MISATTGFDLGKNASRNNVAGRSQKSIAALSIGPFLRLGIGTQSSMLAIVGGGGHPEVYGAVFTMNGLPSRKKRAAEKKCKRPHSCRSSAAGVTAAAT
jgi:hypothetical protein